MKKNIVMEIYVWVNCKVLTDLYIRQVNLAIEYLGTYRIVRNSNRTLIKTALLIVTAFVNIS